MRPKHQRFAVEPIGVIHTPFKRQPGTPIQSSMGNGDEGWADVRPQYVEGLEDLDGFDRVWLIYWLDRARPPRMTVTPFLDDRPRGVFSTRAPSRPNPIGMSCVRVLEVAGGRLRFRDADMLDGTPLIDIKPYAPCFDVFEVSRCGWLDAALKERRTAADRFVVPGEGGP